MRATGIAFLALALASAVVSGAACSKSPSAEKKLAEQMMEKAINQGGGKTGVDLGSDGTVDLSGLPENLRYPGANVLSHVSGTGPDGKGDMYVMETDDALGDVAARYRQSLAGWKQVHAMEYAADGLDGLRRPGGGRRVSIMAGSARGGGKTNVNVTITTK